MLVLAKILRYRCAACHPLQFFTKNILNIQKAQVGIFPIVNELINYCFIVPVVNRGTKFAFTIKALVILSVPYWQTKMK